MPKLAKTPVKLLENITGRSTGGRPSLDFLNSVNERPGFRDGTYEIRDDAFTRLDDVLHWLDAHELLPRAVAARLKSSHKAERSLQTIRAARERIFRCFRDLILEHALQHDTLEEFNDLLNRLPPRELHSKSAKSLQLLWHQGDDALELLLAPIVWDASMLLTSEFIGRVRFCSATDCSWLFLDTSKNGSRRWCDMADCGNREKARRFYSSK